MSRPIIPVILAGGVGSRLWPLSREMYPKQLIALVGDDTMLQATLKRLNGVDGITDPIIVAGEDHRFLVAEQLRRIGVTPRALVLEPEGKNTAPAAAAAALCATTDGDDPLLLVLPADHVIGNVPAFHSAIRAAAAQAEAGKLVTFGIRPDHPETGYGYIKQGDAAGDGAFAVAAFVEKPDAKKAQEFLDDGGYHWNSGMFCFAASTWLSELQAHAPDMLAHVTQAMADAGRDMDFTRLEANAFAACPSDSIDYAVMEKTTSAAVVPVDMAWNDVGSWAALWQASVPDAQGNVLVGDVLTHQVKDCYIRSESRLVAAVGITGHIVVETPDGVLVASREHAQQVKEIVNQLKAAGREEVVLHRTAYRPWGSYTVLEIAPRYQVKRITVSPGAALSLQSHHHRAEHWVVVSGTAKVTRNDDVFLVPENESTFIPIGTRHRLENPGAIPLEMIEVQSGSYLGEDDIVRYDDQYGRQGTTT
ncbi:MAG: mannose-1-phosphate guanylyltransferase/mannose-6-phosphate isomerase [Nitrospirota bacterium]|nr:mannose-1-phosphate guanylyltransferase/mannose-6-phosphate isomerase [Nitrospirota bacterium]